MNAHASDAAVAGKVIPISQILLVPGGTKIQSFRQKGVSDDNLGIIFFISL